MNYFRKKQLPVASCQFIQVTGNAQPATGKKTKLKTSPPWRGSLYRTPVMRLLFLLLLMPFTLQAQYYFEHEQSVPVIRNDTLLTNAWAGGLNAGQYSTIDLNGDGTQDLVIFDRTANKLSTFLGIRRKYKYAPEFEGLFPSGISNWILLADYNCDGQKDIFTSSRFGITVYQNVTVKGGQLSWKAAADPVLSIGSSGKVNLQVNSTDIPGITDLDNDGDLDILVYNFAVGGFIEYHKNLSVETHGDCRELLFERMTRRWGNFEECDCNKFAFGQRCSELEGKASTAAPMEYLHAGGKSILTLDFDNDSDKDLLIGHENCTELYYMENVGSPEEALFTSYQNQFPNASDAASFHIFPAAYFEDLDFDGLKDLLVAPNPFFNIGDKVNFSASNWFYKNTGTPTQPDFQLVEKDFLQKTMIEVGENAVPAFADYDADGDQDMFLGQRGTLHKDTFYGSITLYENTGTSVNPEFTFQTDDYLQISQLKLKDIKIYFADLNADEQPELLVTGTPSGEYGKAQMYLLENLAKPNTPYQYKAEDARKLEITFNFQDHPVFYDINKDGMTDLLLARQMGNLVYYRNISSDSLRPNWEQVNDAYGGIKGSPSARNLSITISDVDANQVDELVTTDNSGRLHIYKDFFTGMDDNTRQENVALHTQTVWNPLLRDFSESRLGEQTWLASVDLFNDGKPSLVVGNRGGGVSILRPFYRIPAERRENIIFPEPGSDKVMMTSDQDAIIQILSLSGQRVLEQSVSANNQATFDISTLPVGIYVVKILGKESTEEKRLILTEY